ncbi:MAG TPA: hypothetical protein RMH85_20950 [Polyangiaceae bacterium LLY-WYZ-15_(1-7)]|nr:hypothetical protein [Myxococcales bacterium]MAT26850.1 hypothetical protein [Sandaracinus sp.]HJL02719.1 hypothetical protein [Polyangiaceae bacterium LLY-WYZ-15_(1-7)]MBJ69919.1 hypothetical protein [Sandaracinus sp.]HJL10956.1 hypothetical protein [Polyangiaceae bacterium LLY-WYZ-15_(1-7)]
MSHSIAQALASVADDDRAGLEAALEALPEPDLGACSVYALEVFGERPLVALRVLAWATGRPAPAGGLAREEWRRALNNACYMAVFVGEPRERRAVVERALAVGEENPAIFHNAACVLCALDDAEGALEALRRGVACGYDEATRASIRDDTDLDLIRPTPAFRALFGDAAPALPAWAPGWEAADFVRLRELVRTSLPQFDAQAFEAGHQRVGGRERDLAELARRCRGLPPHEWVPVVTRFFTG